jgi:hypothetical protein
MTPPGVGENGITRESPKSPRRLRAVEPAEAEPAIAVPLPARALVLGVALAWLGFVLFAGGGATQPSQPERVR